ncbi:hypothetical protein [Mycolicibacterium bacteremicum]|uniref:Minor tail protein n=1 Tax=Mycolicibacterium bacteremicum TaxID=564198 RepID=A0A1W9Z0E2_MYCBA|nr:hypothetical protein [Mycolicibacterium bacteremicum]MCV7434808.1 hypothetical protein [Mycolicibacterium bacteremicum]ORA05798.1 hypothetical protein BST17_08560 [Mycolicibacterium bacteremicum]
MAEILWRTEYRDGVRWLFCNLAELGFRIDDDGQSSGMYLAVAAPLGGVASLGNVLAKGDAGFPATMVLSGFEELDADDPTPASASLEIIAEPTDVSGPVYGLNLILHRGATGESGTATFTPGDISESPLLGWIPAVAPGLSAFELVPQKVSTQHWPATVDNVPGGTTAGFTLTIVPIAAAPYDRYAFPGGTVQVAAASGSNLRVDLIARLDADNGPVVGRDYGRAGATDKLSLVGFPDAGATSSATKILANQTANIYFRTEKQAGSSAYSSTPGTARFGVLMVPA